MLLVSITCIDEKIEVCYAYVDFDRLESRDWMIVYTYTALIILYVLSVFIDVAALDYAVGVIAVIAVILQPHVQKDFTFIQDSHFY